MNGLEYSRGAYISWALFIFVFLVVGLFVATGPLGFIGIILAVVSGICIFAILRHLKHKMNRRSYPIVGYEPKEDESREDASNTSQPTKRLHADYQGGKLSKVKKGFLTVTGLVCFIVGYWVPVPIGEFLEKLILSIMFILLGLLMVLLALRGRPVLASRSSKLGLAFGVSLFLGLFLLVFLIGLPYQIDNEVFYSRALKTDSMVTGISSFYYSEEGTMYRLTVQFTEQRTGNQITGQVTTSNYRNVGSHVSILYDPENPTKIRFDTVNRPTWLSAVTASATMSAFLITFYLGSYVLSVAKSVLYPYNSIIE